MTSPGELERSDRRPRRNQILALSGGGYRGLYTAAFLERCEAHYGRTCREQFGLIAGTSIGALLAAGLACGVKASVLTAKMQEHGPKIFSRRPRRLPRRFFHSAPFDSRAVQAAITDVLTEEVAQTPLSRISTPLLITAVRATTWTPAIFRSRGLAGKEASNTTLQDAILASAAAPTFFPLWRIGQEDYADGGLIANAPDIAALIAALRDLSFARTSTYMLSIGTAGSRAGLPHSANVPSPGVLQWFFTRHLIQMTMGAQEAMAIGHARDLLASRYLRVDGSPTDAQARVIKDLDRADRKATQALLGLAEASFVEHRGRANGLDDCFA